MNYKFIMKKPIVHDDELYHYGRSIKDGAPGVGTGNWRRGNDFRLEKDTSFYRFSSADEKNVRKGTYVSYTPNDHSEYGLNAAEGALNFDSQDANYEIEISNIDPVLIREGKAVIKDILKEYGDETLREAFKTLEKEKYFDYSSMMDRHNIRYKNDTNNKAVKKLGSSMNKYMKEHRKEVADKYRKMGYDAVVDPEDYSWNYESPLFITNPDKFKIKNKKY